MSDLAEWVAIIASGGVGVAGLVAAGLSNRRAQQANELAERANQLAASAVAEAAEANEVAKHANDLSENANAIAARQAAQQLDPSHVEWVAKWDKEGGVIRVTNRGRDLAHDVSVRVVEGRLDKLERFTEPVPREGEIRIKAPEVVERRRKHELSHETAARTDSETFTLNFPFGYTIGLDIRWRSELGNPGQQELKLYVS